MRVANAVDVIKRAAIKDALRIEPETVNTEGWIRDRSNDSRRPVRGINGHQSARVIACSRDTIKGTAAVKRDAAETIEARISDKRCRLVRDIDQPESTASGGMITTSRGIKESRLEWYRLYRSKDIDPPPAIYVIGRACIAALGGRNKDGGVVQGITARGS